MRRRPQVHRWRTRPALLPLVLVIAATMSACSGDDDDDAEPSESPDEPGPAPTEAVIVTPPLVLSASSDPEFLAGILGDGVVSAEEVEDGYRSYIECLAEGGAAGIYAFDLSLRVAYSDWSMADASADANDQAELSASCSRDYLGDLIPRYDEANPPAADLVARQRESIVDCVGNIDPDVAAEIPDVITLDTTGEGAFVGDLALDATALGAEPGQTADVDRCLGALGVSWVTFG